MDSIFALMSYNSTLIGAIAAVGVLAYLGVLGIDPSHALPRLLTGYICGTALVLLGGLAFYFGAAYVLPLVLTGRYGFDTLHLEWIGVGVIALIVGALTVRQAFLRR
ncbi:MAG TPA: hypothetical protein VFQ25_09045 [Ktedonobacterales bacterium]|nr:hypothetical protein [Ktedonobacterales bacterium]